MARKGDPNARRRGESNLEWRARLARQQETDRKAGEDVVTPEAAAKGLDRATVQDEEGRNWNSYRRKTRSALEYMRQQGNLTDEQYFSAQRIAQIAEMLQSSVALGCASMEARVDCSGSARDALNESLYRVRAEGAYTEWRSKLPLPRRMVIDMVTRDSGLAEIAATHNMGWPRARKVLVDALEAWPDIFAKYCGQIDQEDLDQQHARLRA